MNQPRYTCVPSLLNLFPTSLPIHPSSLLQSTDFGFSVSYVKLTLAIYFTCGHLHLIFEPNTHIVFYTTSLVQVEGYIFLSSDKVKTREVEPA